MLFSDLITQIKAEARVAADENFDSVVVGLLNEMFKEAAEAQRPFELRAETTLAATPVTGLTALPADFFVHHQIQYVDIDTSVTWELTDEDEAVQPAPRGMYGHPKAYELLTGAIIIKPPNAIVLGDSLRLVYYKTPPIVSLSALNVANPIPRLEPFLIRAVIRRIRLLHSDDVQVAQMLGGDVASAASAYTKDEPVRNPRPDPSRP